MPSPCLDMYRSAEKLVEAVNRTDVCTLLVMGATWDGHYKAWFSLGLWQAIADAVCDDPAIEVGVFHYSGAPAGEPGSIPSELGIGATLGSYSPRVWVAGRDLGELAPIRGKSVETMRYLYGESWLDTEVLRHCRQRLTHTKATQDVQGKAEL